MVAQDLQSSKKVLTIIGFAVLILGTTCRVNKPSSQGNIGEFIQMKLSLTSNEVEYGDTLTMEISFYNSSDITVRFYPMGVTYLAHSFEDHFHSKFEFLNEYLDTDIIATIEPTKSYVLTKNIYIDSFFHPGVNKLSLIYTVGNKSMGVDNEKIVRGSLESDEFELFILHN